MSSAAHAAKRPSAPQPAQQKAVPGQRFTLPTSVGAATAAALDLTHYWHTSHAVTGSQSAHESLRHG
jgi:hypothetical protein